MKNRYSKYKVSGLVSFDDVPSHWKKNRIKYIGFMYGGLTGKSGDDFRMDEGDPSNKPFIPFTNICNNTYIKGSDLKLVSINEDDNQNRVEKDDLFFMMTSETQEDVGKTSVLKEDLGEVYLNTFCKGYRITNKLVNPYFLNYLLNGKPYREILSVEGNGFTRINLRQDRVNDFVVFTPPLPEQEQIVKYLDEKTTQIDQLISITEKKIEGLKEKRTSLINNVVTKGLDSNVEMKDSGVEWIGKIPKHWSTKKLKYLVKICNGSDFKDHTLDEGGFPVYGTGGEFSRSSKFIYDKPSVLLGRKGTVDKPQFVEHPFWTSDTVYYTEIKDIVNPVFLFHLVCQIKFDLYVYGSAIPSMTKSVYDEMVFPYPPISEQTRIVDFVNDQTNKIDNLISIEKKRIETLKEYRQSLISEVVTGKIRVCDEVFELQES